MLLAAGDGDGLRLVMPDAPVRPGARGQITVLRVHGLTLLNPHSHVLTVFHCFLEDHFAIIVADDFLKLLQFFPLQDEAEGFPLMQYTKT